MQTIAAIATPPGKGGIAVIRVSGDRAFDVADAVFRARSGRRIREIRPRTAVFGDILDPRTGETLDSGVCTAFFAPHSYTGEDTVELSCHGGTLVTTLVLSACFAAGAVQAGPGEFTKRAFLSGKLSLTEAEAVGLLIDADTEEKRKLSTSAVRGVTSRAIAELDEGLFSVMTALYAAIDYPEEDVGDEGERNIRAVVAATLSGVERLLATYRTGRAVAEGVKTVLCGAPNAGKSSLFNAMLGEDDRHANRRYDAGCTAGNGILWRGDAAPVGHGGGARRRCGRYRAAGDRPGEAGDRGRGADPDRH